MQVHTTGAHPFCTIRQAARLGGCLDAPDYVATGATGCDLSVPIWGRDEVAAQAEALSVVEWLRRATSQSFYDSRAREAWEARTAADVPLVAAYVRTLGIEDAADLIEWTAWAATRVEDQYESPRGATEDWGSLMCEVDFGMSLSR